MMATMKLSWEASANSDGIGFRVFASHEPSAFPGRRMTMSDIKVLCVENHPEYLEALRAMLEAAGYEVVPATTGTQALGLFAKQPPQGVLLEYDLPDQTGSSVRAEMKRIKPEVPVLLFSGVGSQTPFLLRFFDSYLRNSQRPEWALHRWDGEA
jgi:CheY-like chemotaxis protein